MNKLSIVKEFWDFLKTRKKWWLIPIVMFLLMLGVVLVAAKGSALASRLAEPNRRPATQRIIVSAAESE